MEERLKGAASLIKNEITNWEQGEAFVTNEESFIMKEVVQKARRNYFGIFSEPTDPVTGRKKLFIPLTEWIVESVVKNIDIDTKDIKVYSRNPMNYGMAAIFRYVLNYWLNKINFGKVINNIIRITSIDGTGYLKVMKQGKEIKVKIIDSLNIITDPSANNLDESPIIEKNILYLPEFREEARTGKWIDWENIKGDYDIYRNGFEEETGTIKSEVPVVEVYERWGYFPKSFITGKENDLDYVYGIIIASDIDEGAKVHFIKEMKKEDCPYTVFKYKDIWNRFCGRGLGEMLFGLQAYINETVNTRMNTARITQLGLWKIRGGVTPQQLSNLFQTQGIKLKGQRDDIERLETGTVDPSSYRDEETAKSWGLSVTGAFDQSDVTASTPATNALIQERGSKIGFNLVQENLSLALTDFLQNKLVPAIKKVMKKGDIIRITGNPADLEILDEKLARNKVYSEINDRIEMGEVFFPEQIEEMVQTTMSQLKSMGENRPLTLDNDAIFNTDFDIQVTIGEEQLNPALLAQSLTQALQVAVQFPGSRINVDEVLKETFDTLGLDGNRLIQAKEQLGVAQAEQEAMAAGMQGQVPQTGELGTNEANLTPTPNSRPI